MKTKLSFGALVLMGPLAYLVPGQISVTDAAANSQLFKQGIQIATQIILDKGSLRSLQNQETWGAQVVLNKLPWATSLPKGPLASTVQNTMGEMAGWGPVLMSGHGGAGAWRNATIQISSKVGPLVLNKLPIGSNPLAEMATVEALNAAGSNNLSVIGTARNFMTTSLPAMQGLQSSLYQLPFMIFERCNRTRSVWTIAVAGNLIARPLLGFSREGFRMNT